MGINGKGVAMESSEQLVKGLGWVGLTLLVAGFDNIKRQPMTQLVDRAALEQILGDSLVGRVSSVSLVLPIVKVLTAHLVEYSVFTGGLATTRLSSLVFLSNAVKALSRSVQSLFEFLFFWLRFIFVAKPALWRHSPARVTKVYVASFSGLVNAGQQRRRDALHYFRHSLAFEPFVASPHNVAIVTTARK